MAFGNNGLATATFGNNTINECYDVAIQADNKIVLVGITGNDFAVARFIGTTTTDLNNFQLIIPPNNSINQNFVSLGFDWSDAIGATSYEIQIDVSATFIAPQTFTVNTSNYNASGLLPNTQYYWRVRASDGTNWGQYSPIWHCTTNTLSNFNLLNPANNATGVVANNVTFTWSDNIGSINYELQIDTSANFSTSPVSYTTSNTSYTTNLLPSKTYYWRVRSSHNGTVWGIWKNAWKFTTKSFATTLSASALDGVLSISPNPANNFITVVAESQLINKPYTIISQSGKTVLKGIIKQKQFTIDLATLSTATYYISVFNKGIVQQKFTKQ
jgi:hypothetical protein